MSNRWFITDYEQIRLDDGFRIEFYTNVPCHLCIYWTTHKPWTHRLSQSRRGFIAKFFQYFCFVSWHKTCEIPAVDTLFHSFTLDDWPFCQTRWFVFHGSIGGEPSPSVSPIFEKHHGRFQNVPPYFNASNHEQLRISRVLGWQDILWTDNTPLKDHLPSNTMALVLHSVNNGTTRDFGLRTKGSTHSVHTPATTLSQQWAFVGVNKYIEAEAYSSGLNPVNLYLAGYVLDGAAVMFTEPYERTPAGDLSWVTLNVSDICPNAIGIIAEISTGPVPLSTGIRYNHSTDNRTNLSPHLFAVIGCDRFQQFEFYTYDHAGKKSYLYICGYITRNATFNINALYKTPTLLDIWQTISVFTPANLAFFEVTSSTSFDDFALRAKGAVHFFDRHPNPRHSFAIIPVDPDGKLEGRIGDINLKFHQIGEGH